MLFIFLYPCLRLLLVCSVKGKSLAIGTSERPPIIVLHREPTCTEIVPHFYHRAFAIITSCNHPVQLFKLPHTKAHVIIAKPFSDNQTNHFFSLISSFHVGVDCTWPLPWGGAVWCERSGSRLMFYINGWLNLSVRSFIGMAIHGNYMILRILDIWLEIKTGMIDFTGGGLSSLCMIVFIKYNNGKTCIVLFLNWNSAPNCVETGGVFTHRNYLWKCSFRKSNRMCAILHLHCPYSLRCFWWFARMNFLWTLQSAAIPYCI